MLPSLFIEWSLSFLVKYNLFCLVSPLSDAILSVLASFFLNGRKVLDVINVYCYCCLILLFFLTCFLNND